MKQIAERYGERVSEHGKGRLRTYRQIEVRPIDVERHLLLQPGEPRCDYWIRALGQLPEGPGADAAVLSYLSDYLLVNASLIPHVEEMPNQHLFVASLNHSMWFHAETAPGEWLLYETESPWAGQARALGFGRFFTRAGQLVASVAREVMVRRRRGVVVLD